MRTGGLVRPRLLQDPVQRGRHPAEPRRKRIVAIAAGALTRNTNL